MITTDQAPVAALIGNRLGSRTWNAVLRRVLSKDPLRTELVAECPHRHRSMKAARLCGVDMLRERGL